MNTTFNTIEEVLEYGPILAVHEEFGTLITVNGAYYNVWAKVEDNKYVCSECYATSFENGMYGVDIVKCMDRAKALLVEIYSELNTETV